MLNYTKVREIHRSTSGTIVLEVEGKSDGKHYALKLIGPLSLPLNRLIFERENNALKALNAYDRIVHIHSIDSNLKYGAQSDYGGILLELIDGNTLEEIDFFSFSDIQKYKICLEISQGILCAHNNGIIHRDIKPGNIMFTRDKHIKIFDFGSSKNKALVERDTTSHMYSPLYSAPEVLSSGVADEASDIYSLGAVFFWIFFGIDPPNSSNQFINSITTSQMRNNFKTLLLRMIDPDPESRLRDVQIIIDEIQKLIGTLDAFNKRYLFGVDSYKLIGLKKYHYIPQQTTMQQFLSTVLPQAFTETWGSFNKAGDKYCFLGNHLYMECVFDSNKNLFTVIALQECTIDRSVKLKRIFARIDGTFRFVDSVRSYADQSDNRQLYSILQDYSSDFLELERKSRLFDDLFGEWELSLNESIDSIEKKSPTIKYYGYDIKDRILSLSISEYSGRNIDEIPPETRYIAKSDQSDKSKRQRLGFFENISYADDEIKLNILMDAKTQVYSIRQNLDRNSIIYEDEFYQTHAFRRQLAAIKSLRNDDYSAPGLKDVLLSLAAPGTVPQIRAINADTQLDEFQKAAVEKALSSECINLIQGPPGTGKTKVIGEIIRQIILASKLGAHQVKLLIVSQSNTAVDNVLENIQKWITRDNIRTIRIGDNKKITKAVAETYTIDAARDQIFLNVKNESGNYIQRKIEEYLRISDTAFGEAELEKWNSVKDVHEDWLSRCGNYEFIDYQLINSASIIAGTCIGFLANDHVREIDFEYVIVDEAAKATTPELLVAIIKAKRIILVGDQNQLPPFSDEELSPIAARLVKDPNFRLFDLLYSNLPDANRQKLLRQYRMIQNIGDLISNVFYENQVSTGVDDDLRQHGIPKFNGVSIVWYNTSHITNHSQCQRSGKSYFNNSEVSVIKSILREFDDLGNARSFDIGIITGYSAQKDRLQKSIANSNYNLLAKPTVDTLDAFQGRQNDIIIYSTVRTEKSIGFQKEKERINVAFSRAKCLLIICGDMDFFYNWDDGENKYVEIINYILQHSTACKVINVNDEDLR